MNRVCIERTTGKLIESQSGGKTHPDPKVNNAKYALSCLDTLTKNAINAGYKEEDIEVKFITDEEFQAIMDAIPLPEPTEEQLIEAKIEAKKRELAIEALQKSGELPMDYKGE